MKRIVSRWDMSRMPAQWEFYNLKSRFRGYGGAMGGGKSRALCEIAWDTALSHPGISVALCRYSHTDIVASTRKLFFDQVCVWDCVESQNQSQGKDYIKLHNKAEIHFLGLDSPVKKFSTEYGLVIVDEAHEVEEHTVVLLNTRVRQRCLACIKGAIPECGHYPHAMLFGFNPENPGHWLHRWFLDGGQIHQWPDGSLKGYSKTEVWPSEATKSLGDATFIFAKATDNPYLAPSYVEDTLGGMPEMLKKRYLEGEWLYVSGKGFFDATAMNELDVRFPEHVGTAVEEKGRAKFKFGEGGWWVWEPPVREKETQNESGEWVEEPAHRYVMSIDVSSGTANDFSAIQVFDVTAQKQVAEYQGMVPTTEVAKQAILAGRIYNMALLVPETTGGWGFAIVEEMRRLKYPRMFTRQGWDRLSKSWTDKVGWDTNLQTRAVILNNLERLVRDGSSGIVSPRLKAEMNTFVWPKKGDFSGPYAGVPQAQPGANDDLVMAYCIVLTVGRSLPGELRQPHYPKATVMGATR